MMKHLNGKTPIQPRTVLIRESSGDCFTDTASLGLCERTHGIEICLAARSRPRIIATDLPSSRQRLWARGRRSRADGCSFTINARLANWHEPAFGTNAVSVPQELPFR